MPTKDIYFVYEKNNIITYIEERTQENSTIVK